MTAAKCPPARRLRRRAFRRPRGRRIRDALRARRTPGGPKARPGSGRGCSFEARAAATSNPCGQLLRARSISAAQFARPGLCIGILRGGRRRCSRRSTSAMGESRRLPIGADRPGPASARTKTGQSRRGAPPRGRHLLSAEFGHQRRRAADRPRHEGTRYRRRRLVALSVGLCDADRGAGTRVATTGLRHSATADGPFAIGIRSRSQRVPRSRLGPQRGARSRAFSALRRSRRWPCRDESRHE